MNKNLLLTSTLLAGVAMSPASAEMNFNRIASFPVASNFDGDVPEETSAEIIDVTSDGMTLVYTDSPAGVIGVIDISDPMAPAPKGTLSLTGEPTAVSVIGSTAFVAVNTSQSYAAPSGMIKAIDLDDMTETASCDLGGQPDSTARARDGSFIAIAIENERDEDLGDGRVPQMPAGDLVMIDISDRTLDCGSLRRASLAGLADVAGSDPEPEFVDINALGEVVVTLQENNHIAVVAKDGTVLSHFSAGAVDLEGIDTTDERGALIFDQSQPGRLREPDGVQWIDDDHFATANEGDMDGGARGMTVFRKDGTVVWESGASLEHAIVQIGHYPDKRSDSKGAEPEGMEFATFDGTPYIFVMAERASIVAVYDVTDPTAPVLKQLLPSGISPEGAVAIPQRGLLATANEFDGLQDGAARAHVMLYQYTDAPAAYPHLTSEGMDELTGWGAISGMVASADGMIYAVSDSFYGYQPRIFKIDPTATPARIVDVLDVTRNGVPAQKLDMEGIVLDGQGGFWIASEGRTDRVVPHALYNVDAKGAITKEVGLPPELMAVEKRFGFEGITLVVNTLWMPVQREWKDDPKDHVKLVAYNLQTEEWGAVLYPKASAATGWVGLSEMSLYGDRVYIIERDNQHGNAAVTKRVYAVPLADLQPAPLDTDLPVVSKTLVRDLLPDLTSTGGYVLDKVEGLAITPDGRGWISTDNDGVDDHSGETMFVTIGAVTETTVN
ncbi:esterase-like activity of phytase family protein [Roseobacter sp. YSTF-M11]|uniref:Esterase-like activity of phytase family protein n=1 Tax=Roseobacter insulae TaxID=2859783 RepID=A0A9X1FT73_9RHOB|nr:esterase-like activity of phytase family protein [Roseobacter insulae]MBW4707197.1 esterase-like activity of phytase family protein [Roseobacter insulae]